MSTTTTNNIETTAVIRANARFFIKEQIDACINSEYNKHIILFERRIRDNISMGISSQIRTNMVDVQAYVAALKECESGMVGVIHAIECRVDILPVVVTLSIPAQKENVRVVREKIAMFEEVLTSNSEDSD